MKKMALLMAACLALQTAWAGLSPKSDNEIYNEGLELLLDLDFKKAEKKFRKVLDSDPDMGEVHNNLAYCLRKQGSRHYDEALDHYNRAVELIPDAPEPYMYRGVLYVSMGNPDLAEADHERLLEIGSDELAAELEWVIENGREKEPEQFFGVFRERMEE